MVRRWSNAAVTSPGPLAADEDMLNTPRQLKTKKGREVGGRNTKFYKKYFAAFSAWKEKPEPQLGSVY